MIVFAVVSSALVGSAAALQLINGKQVQIFVNTAISRNCIVALNTELRRPPVVQSLTYPDYALSMHGGSGDL